MCEPRPFILFNQDKESELPFSTQLLSPALSNLHKSAQIFVDLLPSMWLRRKAANHPVCYNTMYASWSSSGQPLLWAMKKNAAGKKCARTITEPWAPQTCTVWKTISCTSVATIHSGLCQRDVLHVGYGVRPRQLGCVQQFPILYKCCNRRLISGLIKVRLLLLDSTEGLLHFWHLCILSSVYSTYYNHLHMSTSPLILQICSRRYINSIKTLPFGKKSFMKYKVETKTKLTGGAMCYDSRLIFSELSKIIYYLK